jgi:dynein heavy chain, axonemal
VQVNKVKAAFKDSKFNYEGLLSISKAGAGLFKWVQAMVNYHAVAKTVDPKRKKVAEAEKSLRLASKDLVKTQEEVAQLNTELASLNKSFREKSTEQQDLKEKADLMERRLIAASKLIIGLSSEQTRWTQDMQMLDARRVRVLPESDRSTAFVLEILERVAITALKVRPPQLQGWLVGDCLVTSAFLSYTGAFTYEYRQAMIYDTWLKDVLAKSLPVSPEFRVEELLTTEVETTSWASTGLPSDELSIQNGILTLRSSRYPLCIDPQMQAVTWIKRKCGKELEGRVKTFNDSDFLKQLELAIQYGFPFLFENLDEYIDPVIDPVIEKNLTGTNRKVVKLGDKDVEWDDNFRLYMTTKLSNPHYTPEVASKTMIINYSVTQQGLSDQLLNVTVRHERPDLEEQREQLVIEMSDNKAALQELEDTLLYELSNASGG